MNSIPETPSSMASWATLPRAAGDPLYGNPAHGRFVRTALIDDLRLDVTVHAAGARVPDHLHPSPLFLLVLEGEVEERRGGTITVGRAGSLMVLPEGTAHGAYFRRKSRVFSIEPGLEWLSRVGALPLARRLTALPWSDRHAPLALKVYAGFTLLDGGVAGSVALQGYLQALLAEVVQPTEAWGEPLWLREARRYLDDHLAERFDLSALARRVGVHPVHLSRSFRRYFGVTITGYLRQGRLGYAMARLSTSDDAVARVAAGAGFADPSHLTRVFRAAVGTTPAGYRASLRDRTGGQS